MHMQKIPKTSYICFTEYWRFLTFLFEYSLSLLGMFEAIAIKINAIKPESVDTNVQMS